MPTIKQLLKLGFVKMGMNYVLYLDKCSIDYYPSLKSYTMESFNLIELNISSLSELELLIKIVK
jgi:hypothetical protein